LAASSAGGSRTVGLRVFAVAATGASLSDQINGTWFDHMLDYSLDYRAFLYLVAISIGTGLLFGLAPATRLSKIDVNATLKDASRGTDRRRPEQTALQPARRR
jgi:hypothetical protein